MTKKKEGNQLLLRYLAAGSVAAFTAGGHGCVMSWTSPSLVYLKSNKTEFSMTKDEISWIAPLLPIGYNIGHLLIPFIINRFNRKWILLMFSLPQIISWLLIILANNHISIYIARIFGGIGYGGGICALTVFLSEISTQKHRGIFLALVKVFQSLGIFFTMFLGAYSPYNFMNITLLVTTTFFVFTFFFMPDVTYFHKKNNHLEEETKMLSHPKLEDMESEESKLDVQEEEGFALKENSDLKEDKNKIKDSDEEKTFFILKIKETTLWKLVTIEENRRALIIVICCAAQDVFSGHVIIRYFSQQIFTYNASLLAPEKASLLLACIKAISAIICTQVIERVRRKILLLFTGLLGSLGMGLVGLFFFLENRNVNISSITWFPLLGVVIYDVMLTIGFGNFVYLYPGELFPSDLRGVGITSCKVTYYIFAFINIWQYEILVDLVSTYVIFFIFAISGLILCLITLKMTPETQGKNNEEIQILLKSKKYFQ